MPFHSGFWPLFTLLALGCTRRGELWPRTSRDAQVPVSVAVRFNRPGAQLEVLAARGGPIVAHCEADCDFALPPARYELLVTGGGPQARQHWDLRGSSAIRVRVGNVAKYAVGASVGLVGSLAAFALPAALFHELACSEAEQGTSNDSRACNRTTTALAIVGVAGVALGVVGAVVLRANDTHIEIQRAPDLPPTFALFEDATGVGVRF